MRFSWIGRPGVVLGVVCVAFLLLLTGFDGSPQLKVVKDLLAPSYHVMAFAVTALTAPVRRVKAAFEDSRAHEAMVQEAARLHQENLRLREQLSRRERIAQVRQQPFGLATVLARVVLLEPTNYLKGCVVDRGRRDGVGPTSVCLGLHGVAGRVISITASTSKVLFLVDPNCRVAVVDVRSRVQGVVAGTGGSRCSFLYVSIEDDVQLGDVLLTSGLGGVFPKGLPVGRVVRVARDPDGISLKIEVEPFVKFSKLEEVLLAKE